MSERGPMLYVVEVHRNGVRMTVWHGRNPELAQGVCDRLNRTHMGGLDERYPIRYEVCPEGKAVSQPSMMVSDG
jgi:hypothetical protein